MMKPLEENVDYELIPADTENESAWDIRILTGDYVETVIRFGNIRLEEDECIHYNFDIIYSPDLAVTIADEGIQSFAGKILNSVLETAIQEDSLVTQARNLDDTRFTTDDH